MRILAIILLLLSSCGKAEHTWPALIRISPDTEPFSSYAAVNSIKDLNTFMGFEVTKFNTDVDTVTAYPIVVNFSKRNVGKKAGLATIYDDICYITVFPAAIELNLVKTVIWHEIGHCAGLLHADNANEIMSTTVYSFNSYKEKNLNLFKNELKSILKR